MARPCVIERRGRSATTPSKNRALSLQSAGKDRILERAVLPLSRVLAIDQERLERGESLYRFIEERYGVTDDYTEQAFEVDTPSSCEAEQLGLEPGDPIVRVRASASTPTARRSTASSSATAPANSPSIPQARRDTASSARRHCRTGRSRR